MSKFLEHTPKSFEKNNFIIFCTHVQIAVIIKRLLIMISNNELYLLICQFIVCFITIILLNIIIELLKKIFPKAVKIVSGGRC